MKRVLSVCIGLLLAAAFTYADTADRAPVNAQVDAKVIKSSAPGPDYSTPYMPYVKKTGGKVWHIQEGFEASWLPAGWDTTRLSGTYATFVNRVTAGTYPTCSPHSGTYMVEYRCWYASSGNRYRLATPAVRIASTIDSLTFWMTHDNGYSGSNDRLVIQIMVKSGGGWGSWIDIDSISRYQAVSVYWGYHAIPLGAYNGDSVRIGLTGHSQYGNNFYMDDVSIGSAYTPQAGDLELQAIDAPAGAYMAPDEAFTPLATVNNPGTTPVSDFQVIFDIDDGTTKALVYTDTADVAGPLDPGNTVQVNFAGFTPLGLTNYYVTAYVSASGDPNAANDTLTTYFRTFNELQGNVADDNAGGAGLAGATVTATGPSTYSTTTDGSGDYFFFDMTGGTYTVTASMTGYINETVTGVSVVDGAQTTLDISMGYPVLALTPTDSIYVTLGWGGADSTTWQFTVENTGTRDMTYSVSWPELVKGPKAFGDTVYNLDVGAICADNQLLGVEYVDGYLWITGGNNATDPNKLYKIEAATGTLAATYDQSSAAGWGWRDLAYDGTYLYASDDATVKQIDPATGLATGVSITGPTNPCRALAYNPVNDHFYTANFGSSIWEFTRTGTVVNTWANTLAIYGMACDPYNPAGPSLWVWSQDGTPQLTATRFDLTTGTYGTETFVGYSPGGAGLAGGATFTTELNPAYCMFIGLSQDASDYVSGYEIRENNVTWLNVSPNTGTVPAYDTGYLTVTFDAAGLDSFTDYAANVTFNTNAAVTKRTDYVPAYMHVVGTGVSGGPTTPLSYAFGLNANRPNPVSGRTSLSFTLPKAQDYSLKVYNVSGQLVESFAGQGKAGANSVSWNAAKAGAGVYLYRLSSGGQSATRKLVVVK